MFVGEKAAPNIAGASQQLGQAKEQDDSGEHMPHIFRQTDWFKNSDDGQWRREIDDSKMEMTGNLKNGKDPVRLDEAVKHDELFKAAPDLRCTQIQADKNLDSGTYAEFHPDKDLIKVRDPGDKKSTIHEMQHALQQDQNFPGQSRGSSSNDSNYKDNLGEREARDVEDRMKDQSSKPELLHKSGGMKAG